MSTETLPGKPSADGDSAPGLHSFLDELLAEQQRLQTPVARFAAAHAATESFRRAPSHRDLIPLSAPGPGEQYAFEVDLDSCSGCKACVAGCHSLNGLDEHETWRDVGLVVGGDHRHPFQQTITSACHHCADAACANGCPVLAYEKDPVTGIVRHLDDQCIGCSYCILKCPYDVPKFNPRLGIVRKCDMCHGRLAAGEAPACVQACPTEAIRITKVSISDPTFPARQPRAELAGPGSTRVPRVVPGVPAGHGLRWWTRTSLCAWLGRDARTNTRDACAPRTKAEANFSASVPRADENAAPHRERTEISTFLSVAPDPSYTRPTTRYISRRPMPADLRAADAEAAPLQPAHWPLVVLLTLTAMAAGCGAADAALARSSPALAIAGWLAGTAGIAASILHLGQPLRAWRIFLGLRRSWLSREAVGFGLWFPLATAHAGAQLGWLPLAPDFPGSALTIAVAAAGAASLFCSVMVYADTRREFWRFSSTAPRFFGSAAVLGLASALAFDPSRTLAIALSLALAAKLAFELRALRPLDTYDPNEPSPTPAPKLKTAQLLTSPLRPVFGLRLIAGTIVAALPLLLIAPAAALPSLTPSLPHSLLPSTTAAWLVLALAFAGELTERFLYFRAVVAPKMPGLPAFVPGRRTIRQ
ncbi:MAG: DmsC/YnfH family molybdoenzyme membrane anchor subunit [Opitutaceae bacterium]